MPFVDTTTFAVRKYCTSKRSILAASIERELTVTAAEIYAGFLLSVVKHQ